jgi:hypothetical protein
MTCMKLQARLYAHTQSTSSPSPFLFKLFLLSRQTKHMNVHRDWELLCRYEMWQRQLDRYPKQVTHRQLATGDREASERVSYARSCVWREHSPVLACLAQMLSACWKRTPKFSSSNVRRQTDRNDCHTAWGSFKTLISSLHISKNYAYACSFSLIDFFNFFLMLFYFLSDLVSPSTGCNSQLFYP